MKLTTKQVCERLNLNRNAVRDLIVSGQLKAIDVSKNPGIGYAVYRVDEADLLAFEAAREIKRPERKRRKSASKVTKYF